MIRFNFNLRKIALALGLVAGLCFFSPSTEAKTTHNSPAQRPGMGTQRPGTAAQPGRTTGSWNSGKGNSAHQYHQGGNSGNRQVRQQPNSSSRLTQPTGRKQGTYTPLTQSSGRQALDGGHRTSRPNSGPTNRPGHTGNSANVKVQKGAHNPAISGSKHGTLKSVPHASGKIINPEKRERSNDPKPDFSKLDKKKKSGTIIDEGTVQVPTDKESKGNGTSTKPSNSNNRSNSTGEILAGVGILVGSIVNAATNNGGPAAGTIGSDGFFVTDDTSGGYVPAGTSSGYVPGGFEILDTAPTPAATVAEIEEAVGAIAVYNLSNAARTFSVDVDGQTEEVTLEAGESIELNASKVVASFLVRSQLSRYTLSAGQAYKFATGNDGQLNLFSFDPATLERE